MTSPVRGAGADKIQDTEKASAKLCGSPKLTFIRDAGGDNITRSEGTWDIDDGFAIGQRITIAGAMNAGNFTIIDIANDGANLVLDARNTVTEIVTKALSIGGAVEAPADDFPIDEPQMDELTTGGSQPDNSAIEESAISSVGDRDADGVVSDAQVEHSRDERTATRDLSWLFADAPAEDVPLEKSQIENSQTEHSPIQDFPMMGDDLADGGKPATSVGPADSPIDGDGDVEASRRSTHAPGRAIRSRSEVESLLLALCDEKLTVTAYPEDGELLFAARVRAVDPDLSRIVLEYSQWKPANSALLECAQVLFHCERKNRHIQFLSGAPAEIVFDGSAGIQVGFPKFVLDLQQRTDRRFRLATRPSMWCVMKQEGADPIVANVDDISRGGLGGIVHDPEVVLKPGMIIKDCQITGSELKRPIDVSVEIRYWKTIRSQEGLLSKRIGCRFIASSADLQQLIDVFIVDLDDD
jgi:c-di-GMP-binding flagellar brake protein YcgR